MAATRYAYTGGLFGSVYVVTAILLAAPLGFATYSLCAVSGQLLSGLAVDTVGLLGMQRRRPNL
eukprot:1183123-Prorocentrum_minimum.AAC.1